MRNPIAAWTLLAALGLVGVGVAKAEPRALLIGVGEYPELARDERLDPSLPGIDLDLANLQQIARIMGFTPGQVRVLYNGEATHERVVRELSTWTRDGVGQDDPVLIYFSGHGTRVPDQSGDEPDGQDEVLVMSDAVRVRTKKPATLANVLLDDELSALLAQIRSRKILVLVDACNSGTATRVFDIEDRKLGETRGVSKFLYYEDMPKLRGGATDPPEAAGSNYVSLAAAQDTQSAIGTFKGGVFTLGLLDAIKTAAQARHNPTLRELRSQVEAFIARSIDPDLRHNPVLTGDPALAEGGITLVPLENGNGPLWQELSALAAGAQALTVSTPRASYSVGEAIEIAVEAPEAGFLNVVGIDAQDHATVLFPNQHATGNAVPKGELKIPSAAMKFDLVAAAPVGPTLIVAILTPSPLNLRELGIEGRNASGRLTEMFTDVSTAGTRAIVVAARKESYRAGRATVAVVPAASK